MTTILTDDQLVEYLTQTARITMEQHGDHVPTLTVENAEGDITVILLGNGHPYDGLLAATDVVRDLHPVRVSLSSDAYVYQGKGKDNDAQQYAGKLHLMFKAGDPRVTEAMQIAIVSVEGQRFVALPYVRRSNHIKWGEPMDTPDSTGRMVDAMKAMLS